MRVFEHYDDRGHIRAFEIPNLLITRREVTKLVASIPGVEIAKTPQLFRDNDVFCEFVFGGKHIQVLEPFGDNSRYLFTTEKSDDLGQVYDPIIAVFRRHRPIKVLIAAIVGLIVAIILLVGPKIDQIIEQDSCLDHSGSWQNEQNICVR